MKYGITYTCLNNEMFKQARVTVCCSHGFPKIFETYREANLFSKKLFRGNVQDYSVKIESERVCRSIAMNMVEVFSGRKEVTVSSYSVKDETKKTYDDLLPLLMKLAERQGRDERMSSLF